MHVLQVDVTANDTVDIALMNRFGLYALPAILFFPHGGDEVTNRRIVGFKEANGFAANLQDVTCL